MKVISDTNHVPRSKNKNGEIRLEARAVSRGVAIGKVICLHGDKRQFYRINLTDDQIEREIRRFRAAVRLAKRQLKKIDFNNSQIQSNIFEAHLLILEDNTLLSKIEDYIQKHKVNSEWAVKVVTDAYIADYKAIADEHLRERYIDLKDIARRMQTALGGSGNSGIRLKKNSIIVAKEVRPSTLIELMESQPQAIITENGGWTSHTFILAREMNLPSVTGVKKILRRVQTGDQVIVDGFSGQIVLNPSKKTLQQYEAAASEFEQNQVDEHEVSDKKAKTLDGKVIKLRTNLDLPKGYSEARRFGADGIGLYRSEFLFNRFNGFPTEAEQIEAYRNVAETVGAEGVRIRTFDLSLEQIAGAGEEREKNPALGLRAIRLSLTHLKQFRIQLRALLQASVKNNISVILPMISDVSEIVRAKAILENERKKLHKKKIETGKLMLGAMIEVPAAILIIDEIASEVDFLCLGTNDLVQYLLAVDRDNEVVADWFRTLHPAVLRSIKLIVKAAENAGIPAIVCGEMAGSPLYVPILIGLGVTELSMNVKSIPRVRKIISAIAFEEAQEIVKKLDACKTAASVEETAQMLFTEKWGHLFPNFLLPAAPR